MSAVNAAAATTAPEEEMGRWEAFPSLITQRRFFGAAADGDRLLYAVGGAAQTPAEVWNAATGEWSSLPDMNIGRHDCAAAVVDGKLYAVGGYGRGTQLDSVSAYDPNTRLWTYLPPMRTRRRGCAAVAFSGKLFVFGGCDGDEYLASAEVFDFASGSWRDLPDMSVRRYGCAAAVVGDVICVVGGIGDYIGCHCLDSIEVLDPRSEVWSSDSLPPMSCGRRGCAAAGWDGRLYVFGGYCNSYNQQGRQLRSAEAFDVGEGTWARLPDMDIARAGCAAAVVGGRIIVMGGWRGERSCATFDCQYRCRIDPVVAAALSRRQKDGLLHVMMVARRLDDERARQGEGDVGPDLWWRIVGMLRVGDLKQDGSSGSSEDQIHEGVGSLNRDGSSTRTSEFQNREGPPEDQRRGRRCWGKFCTWLRLKG